MIREITTGELLTIFVVTLIFYVQYIANFYLLLDLNMSKRQVRLHLFLSLLWNELLQGGVFLAVPNYAMLYFMIIEISYVCFWIYVFAEGPFIINFFAVLMGSWIGNIVVVSFCSLVCPSALDYVLGDKYQNVEWGWVFVIMLIFALVACLMRKPIRRLAAWAKSQQKIITPIVLLMFVYSIYGAITRNRFVINEELEFIIGRILAVLIALAILCISAIRLKNRSVSQRNRILQQGLDAIDSQYREIWREQKELHKIQHEINNQKNAVYKAREYISEEELYSYYRNFSDSFSLDDYISQCGNVYIDSVVQEYCKKLKSSDVMVETVLEPLRYQDMAEQLLLIMDEMFHLSALGAPEDRKWCRIIMRQRSGLILIKLEIGYRSRRACRRLRWLDMIGNGMLIRRNLQQTRALVWRYNGAWMYDIRPQFAEVAVMLNVLGGAVEDNTDFG